MIGAANIALIGFMGSGKTSVGETLAAMTGMPFMDVDRLVEREEGMSVAEIFVRRSESAFRLREGTVFRQVCEGTGQIIACGGGTLIDPLNRIALQSRCVGVWLRTSIPQILDRIGSREEGGRPLLRGGAPEVIVPKLLAAREGLYQEADLVIDTDGRGVLEIADEIRRALSLPLRPPTCG